MEPSTPNVADGDRSFRMILPDYEICLYHKHIVLV